MLSGRILKGCTPLDNAKISESVKATSQIVGRAIRPRKLVFVSKTNSRPISILLMPVTVTSSVESASSFNPLKKASLKVVEENLPVA